VFCSTPVVKAYFLLFLTGLSEAIWQRDHVNKQDKFWGRNTLPYSNSERRAHWNNLAVEPQLRAAFAQVRISFQSMTSSVLLAGLRYTKDENPVCDGYRC